MADEEVILITGEKVPKALVGVVFVMLDHLRDATQFLVIRELAELCADPGHLMFGSSGATLLSVGLLQDYDPRTKRARVQKDMRLIILAAVEVTAGGVRVAPKALDVIRKS